MSGPTSPGPAVLVPVKAFHEAKARLAAALSPPERAELARELATAVVRAANPLPVAVVCDDRAVADWAEGVGATVLWRPGRGLDRAVTSGVAALADAGHDRVIVAHGDLPRAASLAWVGRFAGVTIVPDRADDGTNVMALPSRCGFRFAYGGGSFARHAAEAARIGLGLRVVRDPALGLDIDVPADLAAAGLPRRTGAA